MHRLPVLAALILLAGPALACALPPSIVLTLPTGYYMAAAAATVALTAWLARHGAPAGLAPRVLWTARWTPPLMLTSYLSLLGLIGLLFLGFAGARDPMHNLLTLIVWTGIWVALPLASMLLGNLWQGLNPWTGIVRLTRQMLDRQGGIGLARLGHWPAVAGLLAFGWFMLVSLSPDDPLVLARVITVYLLGIYILAVLEGEDWLARGEFLTVYLTALSRLAPIWHEGGRRLIGLPGAQIPGLPPLTRSEIAFLTLILAILTFDGLMETFFWLALIGENPLEFTGRSAVRGVNTAGLLAVWALTAATILGAARWGAHLGRVPVPAGAVLLSFLAIAAGYHAAHYLLTLLTAGQYTLSALNDPFFRGDALLGLEPFYVSMGFLTDAATMRLIWNLQFALILGAHLLALVLAQRLTPTGTAPRAHLPMTILMVLYTVLGLWLLSTARGL